MNARLATMVRTVLGSMVMATVLASTLVGPASAVAGPKVVPLSAGTFHTCGLTASGGVMCWGAGGEGALGNGSTDNSNVPVGANVTSGVAAISAGWYHTCALTTAGGGRCWGDDSSGQLGNGPAGSDATPVPVTGYENFGLIEISAGGFHTCAIVGSGVTCWGGNTFGQLGDGGTSDSDAPGVGPTFANGASAIAAGYNHTCAITSGEVWCWGDNNGGQLGDGTRTVRQTPVEVTGLMANAVAVAAGEAHSCALLADGSVACWGDNTYGQLGNGTFENSTSAIQVPGLDSVTAISTHGNTTCALRNGAVLCWGDNLRGQVGDGTDNNVRSEPVQVVGLSSGVSEIAAGYYHSCALTTGGVVTCWGWNNFGQLGDGTNTNSNVPVDVPGSFGPMSIAIDDVSVPEGDGGTSQATFTVTLSTPIGTPVSIDYATANETATADADYTAASGSLTFAPGETAKTITVDVLGDTAFEGNETFALDLSNATGAAIADGSGTATIADDDTLGAMTIPLEVGYRHACALKGGGVKCWGWNDDGQLGDGTTTEHHTAVDVVGLPSGIVAVTAGNAHTCAITAAGGARCWGANGSGQLGDASIEGSATPVQVTGLTRGVVAVSAGDLHSCALLTDGNVTCWGANYAGQLGNGTSGDGAFSMTPVDVSGLPGGVTAISSGNGHTCALTAPGAVWCWGASLSGTHATPTRIPGLPGGVVQLSAGASHDCVVTTFGEVWCWGGNPNGELGNATSGAGSSSEMPVRVLGLDGPARSVSAAFFHTCALTTAGGVECWGANSAGRLGDGTMTSSSVPVPVTGMSTGITDLAAGGNQTCAMPSSFLIRCWGTNANGQLGDGTTSERHAPADVLGFGPQLSVDDVSATEGNSATKKITFTTTLTEPAIASVTVGYATDDDSATARDDYTASSGTLVFAAGDTVQHVSVLVHGDATFEADETFRLVLSGASDAAIADGQGIATIRNDDLLNQTPLGIAAGTVHSCAVTSAQHVKCWGSNVLGEIGDGTYDDRPTATPVIGLSHVLAVASGDGHSCALTTDHGVACWGSNTFGQVGPWSDQQVRTPRVVFDPTPGIAAIAIGGSHSCALTRLGGIKCWGWNDVGQLGDGTQFDRSSPVDVAGLTSGVTAIAAGSRFTCALVVAGTVYCWGNNQQGQLGDGGAEGISLSPVAVQNLPGGIRSIAAGSSNACAATQSGAMWCWGSNNAGQIGDGTRTLRMTAVPVSGLSSGVTAMSVGDATTCAIVTGGVGKCWGLNDHGQVGDGTVQNRSTPVDVLVQPSVTAIATGGNHTCALVPLIYAYCWGDNLHGDLGDGTQAESAMPVYVSGYPPTFSVSDVTVAEGSGAVADFTISMSEPLGIPLDIGYRTESGTAVGEIDFHEKSGSILFEPGETAHHAFVSVIDDTDFEVDETFQVRLFGSTVEGVATITNDDPQSMLLAPFDAGGNHACAITDAGGVKCWGWNFWGQLGDGTGATNPQAGAVSVIDLDAAVGGVSAGLNHTCAVTADETVKCWGFNGSGELGDGTVINRLAPVDVADPALRAVEVGAADRSTCVVTETGRVRCWGSNGDGQLGRPGGDSLVPVTATGLSGVRHVAAGAAHVCAVTVSGGVWCWGRNEDGQLGDGSTSGGATPGPVTGLSSGIAMISAGTSHTCALTTIGSVKCWGDNQHGQLGANSTAARSTTPVDVPGLANDVVAIAAGGNHTCAISSGGGVACWGGNANWELGDSSIAFAPAPVLVRGFTNNAFAIAAGGVHSCAIVDNGLIKCWGGDGFGEIGRCLPKTTILCPPSSTPVDVLGWASDIVIHDATPVEENAGGRLATFEVTLTQPATRQIKIDYATADVTATAGIDYVATSGTVTFAPGDTSENITVEIIGDTAVEPDEQFDVLLGHPVNGPLAWGVGVGTITNDDSAVAVSVDDVSVVEGDTGTTPAPFTVTLSQPSTQPVTVAWGTLGFSAFSDVDFVAASGTLTFAPGETSKPVTIGVVGDVEIEGDEVFTLRLGTPTHASIGKDTGYATIVDDDTSKIAIGDVSVTEGNAGTTHATFAVSLSAPSTKTISVRYATVANEAVGGSDFVMATGTVTFAPGDVDEAITIDVLGDTVVEADETFVVVLSNAVGAPILDDTGLGTIVNDDRPSISIADASVTEGNTGTRQAVLAVTLSAPSASIVTVAYATANASATAGADYQAASGTLTFDIGETAKQIRVDVAGDTLDEIDETFAVNLSNPTHATVADGSGVVTISDDDAPPALSVNDATRAEGDTGTAPLAFTVSLSAPSGKTVTVNVATANGTATAGSDYTATSGTVTIAAGATSAQVSVPIRGDVVDEANETFTVSLTRPANATIADGSGVGTIVDDDPKPVISYFQPNVVAIGDTVTIRGSGFAGATAVSFIPFGRGPIPAAFFQVVNDSKISAIVPPGATTGRVWVTTPNGIGISPVDLLLQPKILSFSPVSGPPGTIVTIVGSGFYGATAVRFGPTPSQPIVVSDTLMMTVVPVGASTSKIQVFTPGGVATSPNKFIVFQIPPP